MAEYAEMVKGSDQVVEKSEKKKKKGKNNKRPEVNWLQRFVEEEPAKQKSERKTKPSDKENSSSNDTENSTRLVWSRREKRNEGRRTSSERRRGRITNLEDVRKYLWA
jgi:hypothetical protein